MIYLIGGPARGGKTTLARRVREATRVSALSGDAVTHSLQKIMTPDWMPGIFTHEIDPITAATSSEAKVDRLRRRDKDVWRFLANYIHDLAQQDIIVDGDLWPDFLVSVKREYKAVFLIDTSPASVQAERLIAIRDSDGSENNWMHDHGYSDGTIAEWAEFNLVRSLRYQELCIQQGSACFDIADGGIEAAEQAAFEYLLGKKV